MKKIKLSELSLADLCGIYTVYKFRGDLNRWTNIPDMSIFNKISNEIEKRVSEIDFEKQAV